MSTISHEENVAKPRWKDLPDVVLIHIQSYLTYWEAVSYALVCRDFWHAFREAYPVQVAVRPFKPRSGGTRDDSSSPTCCMERVRCPQARRATQRSLPGARDGYVRYHEGSDRQRRWVHYTGMDGQGVYHTGTLDANVEDTCANGANEISSNDTGVNETNPDDTGIHDKDKASRGHALVFHTEVTTISTGDVSDDVDRGRPLTPKKRKRPSVPSPAHSITSPRTRSNTTGVIVTLPVGKQVYVPMHAVHEYGGETFLVVFLLAPLPVMSLQAEQGGSFWEGPDGNEDDAVCIEVWTWPSRSQTDPLWTRKRFEDRPVVARYHIPRSIVKRSFQVHLEVYQYEEGDQEATDPGRPLSPVPEGQGSELLTFWVMLVSDDYVDVSWQHTMSQAMSVLSSPLNVMDDLETPELYLFVRGGMDVLAIPVSTKRKEVPDAQVRHIAIAEALPQDKEIVELFVPNEKHKRKVKTRSNNEGNATTRIVKAKFRAPTSYLESTYGRIQDIFFPKNQPYLYVLYDGLVLIPKWSTWRRRFERPSKTSTTNDGTINEEDRLLNALKDEDWFDRYGDDETDEEHFDSIRVPFLISYDLSPTQDDCSLGNYVPRCRLLDCFPIAPRLLSAFDQPLVIPALPARMIDSRPGTPIDEVTGSPIDSTRDLSLSYDGRWYNEIYGGDTDDQDQDVVVIPTNMEEHPPWTWWQWPWHEGHVGFNDPSRRLQHDGMRGLGFRGRRYWWNASSWHLSHASYPFRPSGLLLQRRNVLVGHDTHDQTYYITRSN